MPAKPIRVSAADRRDQIIHVAMRLFARKGFRGTTTREIARRAQVNEAILFRHFPHKEDLYWAVVESKCHGAKGRRELRDTLRGAAPHEALARIAEELLRRNMEDPTRIRLFLYTALENHALSHRFFREHALGYYEILSDYIRSRIRRGEFRRVNPRLAARGFLGMIAQHHQAQELFGGKRYQRFHPHQVSLTLTDIWLGGLEVHNGKRGKKQGHHHR